MTYLCENACDFTSLKINTKKDSILKGVTQKGLLQNLLKKCVDVIPNWMSF